MKPHSDPFWFSPSLASMPITKKGVPISTLDEWETQAGPKRPNQWKDGRSAKEAARLWLVENGCLMPSAVHEILREHPAFGPYHKWVAEPEVQLRFDQFAGEPRNSDMVVQVTDESGPYLIAVECKADESFGETVAEALAHALDRQLQNSRSKGVARIEGLARLLFHERAKGEPKIGHLRYQLLTAVAGAIEAARRLEFGRVVLLVQEFITEETSDVAHHANAKDLNAFLTRLMRNPAATLGDGQLIGPIAVSAPNYPGLYIGKVSHNLRPS